MSKYGAAAVKKDFQRNWILYAMVSPVIVYYLMFSYVPMFGNIMAFREFIPGQGLKGFFLGDWVGLQFFKAFLTGPYAFRVIRNTVLISLYNIVFAFPAPIILALLFNEIPFRRYKRVLQTISYLPHFVSTVVICGMIINFTLSNGLLNHIVDMLGGVRKPMLQDPGLFRTIYIGSGVWQSIGWGTIIYLSAIAGIDTQLYEAAVVDGANRWQQTLNVTIPGIMNTIIILLILRIGQIMSVGSEKIILLYNPSIYDTADVISSYVYRKGLLEMNWSFSAAVGLFNSAINFVLLITANSVSRKVSEISLM